MGWDIVCNRLALKLFSILFNFNSLPKNMTCVLKMCEFFPVLYEAPLLNDFGHCSSI